MLKVVWHEGSKPVRVLKATFHLPLIWSKALESYALGALASPLISLVLTPFLAHHLSPTDYGALSLLYTVIDLVTLITQLGVSSAFFRAYNSDFESPDDRLGILATTITLLSLVSIPVAIVMMLVAPWLSELLLGTPSFSGPVKLTATGNNADEFYLTGDFLVTCRKAGSTLFSFISSQSIGYFGYEPYIDR